MSKVKASFKIVESSSEINNQILNILLPMVSDLFSRVFEKTKTQLSTLVQQAIINSPEYTSLSSGSLKAHFGLPNSQNFADSVVNFYKNVSFVYKQPKISSGKISGQFILQMVKSDFGDIISENFASFTTEKGSDLNWLEWLLLFGDKAIIKDYSIQLGVYPNSRTGLAIMKGELGGKWHVPYEFSGIASDNWITRAIDSIDKQIETLFIKTMEDLL